MRSLLVHLVVRGRRHRARFVFISLVLASTGFVTACGTVDDKDEAKPAASTDTVGTAQPATTDTEPTTTEQATYGSGPPVGITINWEHPDPMTRRVDSIETARGLVRFSVRLPPGLGQPTDVFVSVDEVPAEHRLLILRFEHPKFGVFLIQQLPLPMTVAAADEALATLAERCRSSKRCAGDWSLPALRSRGRPAVLIAGPPEPGHAATAAIFNDRLRKVRVEVLGPPETFSGEAAVAVADAVASEDSADG